MKNFRWFFLALLLSPLYAQTPNDFAHFQDLLPQEILKEKALISQVDDVKNLLELPTSKEEKKPESPIESFSYQQQAQYIEQHGYDDLKAKKSSH